MGTTSLAPHRLSCTLPGTSTTPGTPERAPRELFATVRADSGSLVDGAAAFAVLAAMASPSALMTLALAEAILR